MGNAVAWVAIAISVVSAAVSLASYWTNREKLRLDLYDRRFRIYESALTLHDLLWKWSPTANDVGYGFLFDSTDLKAAISDFQKKSAEGQFLFSHESEVPELLQQFCKEANFIVNVQIHNHHPKDWSTTLARFAEMPGPLREKMSPFLNFHRYSALPRLPFEDSGEWGHE
jgi:hypothetical protein